MNHFINSVRTIWHDCIFYAGILKKRAWYLSPILLIITIFFNLSFQCLVCYRIAHWFNANNLGFLGNIFVWLQRVLTGCYINPLAMIGKNVKMISHAVGIVIGPAKIGDNVTIWQNVTIGSAGKEHKEWPNINDNVRIYANAVIIGGVHIGEGAQVGALTLVNRNVPSYSLAIGIPCNTILS